jgi:cytoskeletal protein CcmA (bactofilin family)
VEVGGSINTGEGVTARSVEIANGGKVQGPIRAEEIVIGRHAEVEDLHGKSIILRSGATANNVYGQEIFIESHCRVNGELQYIDELRQSGDIAFAQPPKKVTSLPT